MHNCRTLAAPDGSHPFSVTRPASSAGRYRPRKYKIGNRIQVLDTAPVEKTGEIDRMLHGVHHDLGATVRDKRDELKTIAASATKFQAPRLPWTSRGR